MIFVHHCLIFKKCIMKNQIISALIFFALQINSNAQIVDIQYDGTYLNTFGSVKDYKSSVYFNDGKIIIKNAKGSPLLYKGWKKCVIKFADGRKNSLSNVNYDALNDHFVMYIKNYTDEFSKYASKNFPVVMLKDEPIFQVNILDNEVHQYVKISESNFAFKPKNKFFEFFSENFKNIFVLKKSRKKLEDSPKKPIYIVDNSKPYRYILSNQYFVKNKNKKFVETLLKKSRIFQALHDPANEKALKKFVKKNKLKLKKPRDVQKMMEYYHGVLLKKEK